VFECNNVCILCKVRYLDKFWKYFVDGCVFNDDTSVLYNDSVGVAGGCMVSMQVVAISLFFAVVFVADLQLFMVNCIHCFCVNS